MGAGSRHSVALVLLVTLMMVATSHWMMSNKSSATSAGAGSDVASAGWCNGSTIDGKCVLIAPSDGGDHVDLNMQDFFDMVVEYDSGESSRRVLAEGGVPPLNIRDAVNNRGRVCNQGGRYTCQNKGNRKPGNVPPCPPGATYQRNCFS